MQITGIEKKRLSETDITRLVLARTFLYDLEACMVQRAYEDFISPADKSGALNRRFEKQFTYVDRFLPLGWHYGAVGAEEIVPESFRQKLADPAKKDHNRQHYGHVGNNFVIGSAYDLVLPSFKEADLRDAAMVGMNTAFDHDHLQIDRQRKLGHDYLGGLYAAAVMRLGRIKYGLPYTERQEKLAYFAVYWHSYPEKMLNSEMLTSDQLLQTYGESFGLNDLGSLLYWCRSELAMRGIDLADFSGHLPKEDEQLGKWLAYRLAAADKRASYAPPFLSILRTMATGEKPFINKDSIGQSLDFFLRNIKKEDIITRTIFEDIRDLRQAGMSAFEIAWLQTNKVKKLDYLLRVANCLLDGDFNLIERKFGKYISEGIYEFFREERTSAGTRTILLEYLPKLLIEDPMRICPGISADLAVTIRMIAADYGQAVNLLTGKREDLIRSLTAKEISKEKFIGWLDDLIGQVKERFKVETIGRYGEVPENLPVYCATLGVIK